MSHVPVGTVFKPFVGDTGDDFDDFIEGPNSRLYDYKQGAWADYVIDGNGGNDTLIGGHGDDSVYGGTGNDVIQGGYGINDLYGEEGINTLSYAQFGLNTLYAPGVNGVYVDMIDGITNSLDSRLILDDQFYSFQNVTGSQFKDQIYGDIVANDIKGLGGRDFIDAGGGEDFVLGGLGNDSILGGDGSDDLYGNRGNDSIAGGNGDDFIAGGRGNDRISGDFGADYLSGGLGVDTFVFKSTFDSDFSGEDFIADFRAGIDYIDVRAIDASDDFGKQNFIFIGKNAFDIVDSTAELRYFYSTDTNGSAITILEGDTNGDRFSDFSVSLAGRVKFEFGDILTA